MWAKYRQHCAHYTHVLWLRKLLDNPQICEAVQHDGYDLCNVNITFLVRSVDAEEHHNDLAHCYTNHLKLVWVLRFPRRLVF